MKLPYHDFAAFLAEHFPGKMQKIAVDAGFTCPNRDGTISTGGCSYCCNASFSPAYCHEIPDIKAQLEEGKRFFGKKYSGMRYLAYFQSYTSTHGRKVDQLMELYNTALEVDGVDGLIIGTRPDCVDVDLLKRIASLPWAMMEYGAESSHDETLAAVNRGHTWEDVVRSVNLTAEAGMPVGIHLIMGLPGETRDMMLRTIDRVNDLPVDVVKIHQLQLLRGTRLTREVETGEKSIIRFTPDSYISLCAEIINHLRQDIAIERFVSQAPADMLVYPRWGLKNYQFTNLLINYLNGKENDMGSQPS
ncbi:MAG: TIGR01212 family radical SAM protein [Lachnoclostridium sp.]|nr:TIGR01212 family radical SAM protein [Lachnoclostridium sp.]